MAHNEFDISANYEKAQKNFEKAAECCSQGRFNAAKDLLQKGIKACPEHSESYRLLGQVYLQEGELTKAENAVIEALRINPKNMWALILMGNILAKNKDKDAAAEGYYQKVLEYYPDNAIALNNVGAIFMQRGNYAKGEAFLKKALELDDSYLNSYYGLALAYYNKEEYDNAFEWAFQGAKKGLARPEDANVRQELLKLLLTVSREICDNTDYESMVLDVGKKLEQKYNIKIEFVVDPNQDTLAHLKFADFYHTDVNVVRYKREGYYSHYILHELMHLDMMMDAKRCGTLKVIGHRQSNFDAYMVDYQRHYDMLKKSMDKPAVESLAKQLFTGMSLQTMNCPLDLFVEQKIYDMEDFRPLQLVTLVGMESGNVSAVKQTAAVQQFPQQVKDVNKQLCIVQSLMLKRLYSIDFVAQYVPSQNMLHNAQDYFGRFELALENFAAGDEYKLFEHFAKYLGIIKYFDISDVVPADKQGSSDELATDADRKQEDFNKTHDPKNVDPSVTLMMANFMVGAMEYFESLLPEEVKKIAFEIAMVGQNGISPTSESGYNLRSIPNKHFSGYELLAYYYVSWAQAAPEMLNKLGLPFDDAYEMAKKMRGEE